jgi:hypothetical protein
MRSFSSPDTNSLIRFSYLLDSFENDFSSPETNFEFFKIKVFHLRNQPQPSKPIDSTVWKILLSHLKKPDHSDSKFSVCFYISSFFRLSKSKNLIFLAKIHLFKKYFSNFTQ